MGKRKAYGVQLIPGTSLYRVVGPLGPLRDSYQRWSSRHTAEIYAHDMNAAHDLAIKLERQRQRARARRAKGRRAK
jgi:hypothetical protein